MFIKYDKTKYLQKKLEEFFKVFITSNTAPTKRTLIEKGIVKDKSAGKIRRMFLDGPYKRPIEYITLAIIYLKFNSYNTVWENSNGDKTYLFESKTIRRIRELYKFFYGKNYNKQ